MTGEGRSRGGGLDCTARRGLNVRRVLSQSDSQTKLVHRSHASATDPSNCGITRDHCLATARRTLTRACTQSQARPIPATHRPTERLSCALTAPRLSCGAHLLARGARNQHRREGKARAISALAQPRPTTITRIRTRLAPVGMLVHPQTVLQLEAAPVVKVVALLQQRTAQMLAPPHLPTPQKLPAKAMMLLLGPPARLTIPLRLHPRRYRQLGCRLHHHQCRGSIRPLLALRMAMHR